MMPASHFAWSTGADSTAAASLVVGDPPGTRPGRLQPGTGDLACRSAVAATTPSFVSLSVWIGSPRWWSPWTTIATPRQQHQRHSGAEENPSEDVQSAEQVEEAVRGIEIGEHGVHHSGAPPASRVIPSRAHSAAPRTGSAVAMAT